VVTATIELVGGGGGLIKCTGDAAAMEAAAFGKTEAWLDPSSISMAAKRENGPQLKAPEWAYGTFKAGGRPLDNLETTAGESFEGGEQTPFIIGGSMTVMNGDGSGSTALSGPREAREWAWAGYNLLAMQAPAPVAATGFNSGDRSGGSYDYKAFGDLLDWGFAYEYFGVLEVVSAGDGAPAIMTNATIEAGVDAYRCHGRFGGLHLADLGRGGAAGTDAVADVARAASCLVRQA
jgi:hypothetical protein